MKGRLSGQLLSRIHTPWCRQHSAVSSELLSPLCNVLLSAFPLLSFIGWLFAWGSQRGVNSRQEPGLSGAEGGVWKSRAEALSNQEVKRLLRGSCALRCSEEGNMEDSSGHELCLAICSLMCWLLSCSLVNRRLNQLSSHDPLWKRPCRKYWLVSDDKRKKGSWKNTFIEYHMDMGRYIHHYAKLKAAWDALKEYLGEKCPRMISSLKAGVQEEDLNAVEERIGCKLPDDYRCSLRIHNGQKLVVPGLMGSMALSNHYRSEDLLDIDTAAGGFQRRTGLNQCLPITFCIHTGLSQYLALADAEGRNCNEIFYQCPDQTAHNPAALDMFVTGTSFSQWFTSYVKRAVSGDYPIIRDQIFRYEHDKDCVATTDEITVSVSTSFLPELSSIHPPHFFFTYRIKMQMAKEALPEKACQLDCRYWRITNAKGHVEEVQGPGVVGDYPVLRAGQTYEYTSCTTFSTTAGYMEGYYTFHRLDKESEVFNVTIPRFHMKCPTFRVSNIATDESCNDCFLHDDDSTDTDDYEERRRVFDMPNPPVHCPRYT